MVRLNLLFQKIFILFLKDVQQVKKVIRRKKKENVGF